MKSVLISIQPKWCELIASGKKTVEVRKTCPKLETPFKCYIYCSTDKKPKMFGCYDKEKKRVGRVYPCNVNAANQMGLQIISGKVIGEFVCDSIEKYLDFYNAFVLCGESMCLTYDELQNYCANGVIYGWHISDLKIYDNPKELGEFKGLCKYPERDCGCCPYFDYTEFDCKERILTRPPQSWCYVDGTMR